MNEDYKFGIPIPTFKEVTGVKDGHFLDKDGNPIDDRIVDTMRALQDAGLEEEGWELVSIQNKKSKS